MKGEKNKVIHVDICIPMKLEKRENEIREMIEDTIYKVNQEYGIMIKVKIMHNHRMDRKIKIEKKRIGA